MSVTENNLTNIKNLKLLGDFWVLLIIDLLSDGSLRFRDFERLIEGVSTATLTKRLKYMETQGLVKRDERSKFRPTYELTDLGQQAVPILSAIDEFSSYASVHRLQVR